MARNRRLAFALALTDDEEENHVPARLCVQMSLGEGSSNADQELRFDDARFAAYCDWSADSLTFFNFFLRSVREKKAPREAFSQKRSATYKKKPRCEHALSSVRALHYIRPVLPTSHTRTHARTHTHTHTLWPEVRLQLLNEYYYYFILVIFLLLLNEYFQKAVMLLSFTKTTVITQAS